MVTMQCPFLQLLDCGMTIGDKIYTNGNEDINHVEGQEEFGAQQSLQGQNLHSKGHVVSNELVIKHLRLKKKTQPLGLLWYPCLVSGLPRVCGSKYKGLQ